MKNRCMQIVGAAVVASAACFAQSPITEFGTPPGVQIGVFDFSGITSGPDGNLWFTDVNGGVGRITTSGAITTFPLPNANSGSDAIIIGPDGNLWFTESLSSKIGRITTSGAIT